MAKLKAKDYKTIIDRTIAGDTRSAIAKDLPVDRRRVSKIICDLVDGVESDYIRNVLGDYFDENRKELVRSKMNPGRSRKHKFLEMVDKKTNSPIIRQLMIESYEFGYSTGYNCGRARGQKG